MARLEGEGHICIVAIFGRCGHLRCARQSCFGLGSRVASLAETGACERHGEGRESTSKRESAGGPALCEQKRGRDACAGWLRVARDADRDVGSVAVAAYTRRRGGPSQRRVVGRLQNAGFVGTTRLVSPGQGRSGDGGLCAVSLKKKKKNKRESRVIWRYELQNKTNLWNGAVLLVAVG